MKSNKKKIVGVAAIALSVALAGFVGISALGGIVVPPATASAESFKSLTQLASTASDLESPFKTVYEEVSPSIVGIKLTTQLSTYRGRISVNTAYVGSGVIISDDGYVVTNYHVITAGGNQVAQEITVVHGEDEYLAEYVAGDSASDVAVLHAEGLTGHAAKLGNSDEISIGDWSLVIGNPLGEEFANTLTVGVISGKNRDMSSRDARTGKVIGGEMLQTNAQVNNGNSGGGLFNIRGELVGITSLKLSNSGYFGGASIEGFGFAIPINKVVEIADDLIEYGEVREPAQPRIGISIQTTDSDAEEPSEDSMPASVLIVSVEKKSPADRAGLKANDLIMRADGKRVKTVQELQEIVRSHEAGETVEIEVYRIPNLRNVLEDEPIPAGETITVQVDIEILDEVKQ